MLVARWLARWAVRKSVAQTYVVPATDNTCAPEPQRFISVIGEVT